MCKNVYLYLKLINSHSSHLYGLLSKMVKEALMSTTGAFNKWSFNDL